MVDAANETPRVSIITGFYNRGHLLDRTLQSLLAQTYANLEIIVFDDHSTDDTSQRLDAYEALKDPRLKIIRHPHNLGFTQGMVNAISQASGEYIAVQGSGDVSMPTRVADQVKILVDDSEIVVVGCHYENIVEENGIRRLRTPCANSMNLKSLSKGNIFSHGEVMFRLLSYNKCGGYRSEFRYCQDYDLWLRMIKLGRFFTVPKTLYHRYVQFDGVSYAPQKATEQWHYSIAAKRIASSKPEEAAYLFSRLKNNGPTAVVGRSDPEIQRRALKATIRLVAWGRPQQARITANYISKPALRYLVQLMCSIAEHPGGALTLRWAASFVGVRNHDGFPG